MADKPILFSAPMVRALLDGRKMQTRRVLKPQPEIRGHVSFGTILPAQRCVAYRTNIEAGTLRLPYAPGDRLYVKEAWKTAAAYNDLAPSEMGGEEPKLYDADSWWDANGWPMPSRWGRYRHARFMPRWASRLTLTVTDVRVQRLQEISEADAKAEGIRLMRDGGGVFVGREGPGHMVTPWPTAKEAFSDLWDSINGPDALGANPWVVALTFDVHRCNIDSLSGS